MSEVIFNAEDVVDLQVLPEEVVEDPAIISSGHVIDEPPPVAALPNRAGASARQGVSEPKEYDLSGGIQKF